MDSIKNQWFILFWGLSLLAMSSKLYAFVGGNGSEQNPFLISSCAELQNMSRNLSAHYKLANDIDCTGFNSETGGFYPVGDEKKPFTGKLDGNDKQIKKLSIERFNMLNVGLFGVTKNASVINLKLVAPYMKVAEGMARNTRAGFLIGESISSADNFSEFSNIGISNGSLNNGHVMGALIGKLTWHGQMSKINNIRVIDTIIDMEGSNGEKSATGGVIGSLNGVGQSQTCEECKISNIHFSGGKVRALLGGGLLGSLEFEVVGKHKDLIIENSSANTTVQSYTSGGLIGYAMTSGMSAGGKLVVRQSWAHGEVLGFVSGGFIGVCGNKSNLNIPIIISQSYSKTNVNSYQAGGFAGALGADCVVSDAYAQGKVVGVN